MWGGGPIPMPARIGFSLRRGRRGSLTCMWVVQTHSGPSLFQVLIRGDCVVSLSMKLVTGHRNRTHDRLVYMQARKPQSQISWQIVNNRKTHNKVYTSVKPWKSFKIYPTLAQTPINDPDNLVTSAAKILPWIHYVNKKTSTGTCCRRHNIVTTFSKLTGPVVASSQYINKYGNCIRGTFRWKFVTEYVWSAD